MRVLLTISTCPYLIPKNRARSLSTAMEVSVARDTPKKTVVTIYAEFLAVRQRVQFSVIRDKNIVIANGCEMRPAQRSVIVKLRSKIFDVGRRDASFSFQAERIFTAYVFPPAWDNNKNLNNKSNPKPPSFGARCSSPLR